MSFVQGHVKMNAFFYDYDDFDHTTELVDWFETELSGQGQMKKDGQHELLVSGNRQNEKTRSVCTIVKHFKQCLYQEVPVALLFT